MDENLLHLVSSTLDIYTDKIYIVKTVDELLFSGYQDDLLDMVKESGLDENPLPFDKFGWFYEVVVFKKIFFNKKFI